MKKEVVIAVSGPPGSGKTTYARMLSKEFNLRYVSAGLIFRRIAEKRNLSIIELSKAAEKDPTVDLEIDRRSLEEALKGNVVLDGHLTAWIVRHVADFTVYLTAPLKARVKRIALRDGIPYAKALEETIIRENSQRRRYYKYYGIDVTDTSWFNLVLNTENLTIEEAYSIIRDAVEYTLKLKRKF